MKYLNYCLVLISLIFFAACGGGSSNPGGSPAEPGTGIPAGNLGESVTGTYKTVVGENTCYTDLTDVDELWIEIKSNRITRFELDDDNTEIIKSVTRNNIQFSYEEAPNAVCNLTLYENKATGTCSARDTTCNLSYVKCSDEIVTEHSEKCATRE